MSFSKTVSVCAALASIFAAGTAGWKLAQESQMKPEQDTTIKYEERINELQQQVSNLQQQAINNTTTSLPQLQPQPQIQTQILPPPPPVQQPSEPQQP
jgi:predicted negative regulator of RcsB-dependent stress response